MFNDVYRDKRVLLTGHTGFKGAWLGLWLSSLGAKVAGFSIDIPTQPSLFEAAYLAGVMDDHRGDVRDFATVAAVLDEVRPDFVFHLAAQPIVKASYDNPRETFQTNVLGTLNVLDSVRSAGRPCYAVMITSDKCYENVEWTWGYRENDRLGGKDPYSASKAAAEAAIYSMYHSYFHGREDRRVISVRAGNVIGGGDWAANRIVPDAMRSWAEGEPVVIRSPKSTRPWQHVLEPLSGYLRAGQRLAEEARLSGESYNFGPRAEQSHTVLELLEALARGWTFDDVSKMVRVDTTDAFHEAGLLKLNCDKAQHDLQWQPTMDFLETAEFTSEWYGRFYSEGAEGIREATLGQIESYVGYAKARGHAWSL